MTVRAVDMATMLPRLGEAGRQQHNAEVRPTVHGQVQAQQEQQRVDRSQKQVNHRESAGQVAIQKDGGKGSGGAPNRQGKKEPAEAKAAAKKENPVAGGRLDVKV